MSPDGKIGGVEMHEIQPGEVFEPTAKEVASFGDLMAPVGPSPVIREESEEPGGSRRRVSVPATGA